VKHSSTETPVFAIRKTGKEIFVNNYFAPTGKQTCLGAGKDHTVKLFFSNRKAFLHQVIANLEQKITPPENAL